MEVGRNINANYIECSLGSKFQFAFDLKFETDLAVWLFVLAQSDPTAALTTYFTNTHVMGRKQKRKEAKTIEQKKM